MVAIPPRPEQEVIDRVYAALKAEKAESEIYLGRLGSSNIGADCLRSVWFSWRAYSRVDFDGRMLRLFDTGHLQEARIVEDLRRAGFEVFDRDPQTGNQFEYSDETGHLVTKLDGVLRGMPGSTTKPHLLEIKTHNKNSFSGLLKNGVLQGKPQHYAQMQISMALSGLERALYVALCKDDEQLYVERVKEDKDTQQKLLGRVNKLLTATIKPVGLSDDGQVFGCKYCDHRAVCLNQSAPLRTCRSCRNAKPGPQGSWSCALTGSQLSKDQQRAACADYEVL